MAESARNQTDKEKEYKRKLFWRKSGLYLLLILAFCVCLVWTYHMFIDRFDGRVYSQINRAISQISKLLPQVQDNENAVRSVHTYAVESRAWLASQGVELSESSQNVNAELDTGIIESLSWMERVTHLKVGYNGSVIIVSKADGTILAHPDKQCVGQKLTAVTINYSEKEPGDGFLINTADYKGLASVNLNDFSWQEGDDLHLPRKFFVPEGWKLTDSWDSLLDGSVVSYEDIYIIVGVGFPELASYLGYVVLLSVLALIVLWIFVKFICLYMDKHEERAKALRPKLVAYGCVLCVLIFGVSWYVQILYDVSNDLRTMEHHAQVAVETLDAYQNTQEKINIWLDEQYLAQCRAAGDYLAHVDRDSLTREDMANLADVLGLEYVFLYDKNGSVVVTNSPYDHFTLSEDPNQQSYAFRALLQGVDHLVQQPMPEELSGKTMQYIGVSLRDENDLSDGFVQIGVTSDTRNELTKPLDVNVVLETMVIGLPEHAVAIDKQSLTLVATTGVGFVGETNEEFGIVKENLQSSYSGFLRFNGQTYYSGVGETADYYLVPVMLRTNESDTFMISLIITAVMLTAMALIILLTLFHYDQDVVDPAPEVKEVKESEPENNSSAFASVFKVQQKWGFEKRWRVNVPKDQMTPEMRIQKICFRMLLIFCVLNLIPFLYAQIYRGANISDVSGLAYVLSGKWEKGLNIFAFSSCVFLSFVLYVFSSLTDRVLYHIARVSDMRTETVCLLLKSSLRYVVFIVFVYFGLAQFGIPSQALLASAGIVTLAVSMGAKDFINDIIAGFFILIEGNFKVGDFVTIGNWWGFVEQIGIRTTKVGFRGETKIFNNSSIRDVINDLGPVNQTTVKVPIALTEDLASVTEILNEELPKLMDVIPSLVQPPYYNGVDQWTTNAIILRVRAKTKVGEHYATGRLLSHHLKLIFDRHGIKIPYQQVDVHMPSDAENSAPSKNCGETDDAARNRR